MKNKVVGFSEGFHDASLAIIENDQIVFASQSERYSRIKNDKWLHQDLIDMVDTDEIAFYERPWLKRTRQIYAGQPSGWKPRHLSLKPKHKFGHHLTHAATAFQTSPFERATVIVVDAIGEWDTVSIWLAEYRTGKAHYRKMWSARYPYSLGLFYSAITQHVGLKPNEDEYILMGMASYGQKDDELYGLLNEQLHLNNHRGCRGKYHRYNPFDLAYNTQRVLEETLKTIFNFAVSMTDCSDVCYGGGVALNCKANTLLRKECNRLWIPPHPADGGSAIGSALLVTRKHVDMPTACLGYNIDQPYPVENLLQELKTNGIVGVANGPAEFGHRALGNRSLLADPRTIEMKNHVNAIKQRQEFRPFAPVILEEDANLWFDLKEPSPYMQYIVKCFYPEMVPAVCHVDRTSRVQTVPRGDSGIRRLLERWKQETGCSMLLNTSLNIKGQPIVNSWQDAKDFESKYKVKIY